MLAGSQIFKGTIKSSRQTVRVSTISLVDSRAMKLIRRIQKVVMIDSLNQSAMRALNKNIMAEYFKVFLKVVKGQKDASAARQKLLQTHESTVFNALFELADKSLVELVRELIQEKEGNQGNEMKFVIGRILAVGFKTVIGMVKCDDWDLILNKGRKAAEDYLESNPQPTSYVVLNYQSNRAAYEEVFLLIVNCGATGIYTLTTAPPPAQVDLKPRIEEKKLRQGFQRQKINLTLLGGRSTVGQHSTAHRKSLIIAGVANQLEKRIKMMELILQRLQVDEEYDDIRTVDTQIMGSKMSRSIDSKTFSMSKDSSDEIESAQHNQDRKRTVRIMAPKESDSYLKIMNLSNIKSIHKDNENSFSDQNPTKIVIQSSQIVSNSNFPKSAIKKISKFDTGKIEHSKTSAQRPVLERMHRKSISNKSTILLNSSNIRENKLIQEEIGSI